MVVMVEMKGFDKEDGEHQEQLQKQQPMIPPPSPAPPPPLTPGQQQPEASDTAWGLGSHPPDLQDGGNRRVCHGGLQQQQVQQQQPQQQQQLRQMRSCNSDSS